MDNVLSFLGEMSQEVKREASYGLVITFWYSQPEVLIGFLDCRTTLTSLFEIEERKRAYDRAYLGGFQPQFAPDRA